MANHLAMAALLEQDDEVLIEEPTYEPILAVARYLGAKIRRFPRRFEDGFRLDPREVERGISPRTRLIVLTNLHNPTGVRTADSTLKLVGDIARSLGAHVLVDEVYLDDCFDSSPKSAFHLGPNFVTTSSLTKAYGLSGLRCGWILAAPALAERMWRLNDLFGVVAPHPIELLSVIALDHLPQILARSKKLLDENRALLKKFLDSRTDLLGSGRRQARSCSHKLPAGTLRRFAICCAKNMKRAWYPADFRSTRTHSYRSWWTNGECAGGSSRMAAALDEFASKRQGVN